MRKDVVKRLEQLRNGFLSFVAHVGEPEGLAFDFAVAGVDDEVMFFAEIAGEFQNIDSPFVFDAGQRLRPGALLSEETETALPYPIVDQRIRPRVTLVAIRQAFGENIVEF